MEREEKIVLALVLTIVGHRAYANYRIRKMHRKTNDAIDETINSIKVIEKAKNRMLDRIYAGDYKGKSIEEVLTDFRFEQIAIRNGE